MAERVSDEHMALLEASLANVENDYRPTCESVSYGSGCPGPTDASLDFWRRAVDAVPSMLAEIREYRSGVRVVGNNVDHGDLLRTAYLTGNEMDALRWLVRHYWTWLGPNVMNDTQNAEKRGAIEALAKIVGGAS